MNGWFPAVNGRGEIVSGAGEMFLGEQSLGVGWRPKWVDDDTIVFDTGHETQLLDVRTGLRRGVGASCNDYAAGYGLWLGLLAGNSSSLRLMRGPSVVRTWTEAAWPAMSPLGRYVFGDRYHGDAHTVWLGDGDADPRPVYTGATMDLSVCESAVCIMEATGVYTRRVVGIRNGRVPEDWSVLDWEAPIVCDGPDGPWVLSVTQTGLILRAARAWVGYSWAGEWFNPSVRFVSGRFLIAASDGQGRRRTVTVDPQLPRSPLNTKVDMNPPIVNTTAWQKAEVTVDAFTLTPAVKLPDGTVLEFHDRVNPHGARARVWVESGSARMSIDYPGVGPGLKGETSARRPVR